MNKRKILILLVLTIAVIGFTMPSISAASTVVKLKKDTFSNRKLGHGDSISSAYHNAYWGQCGGKRHVHIEVNNVESREPHYYKITKAKVYYKYKGKVKTKTYKGDRWGYSIDRKIPKGYTPFKAQVYYKRR